MEINREVPIHIVPSNGLYDSANEAFVPEDVLAAVHAAYIDGGIIHLAYFDVNLAYETLLVEGPIGTFDNVAAPMDVPQNSSDDSDSFVSVELEEVFVEILNLYSEDAMVDFGPHVY